MISEKSFCGYLIGFVVVVMWSTTIREAYLFVGSDSLAEKGIWLHALLVGMTWWVVVDVNFHFPDGRCFSKHLGQKGGTENRAII